MFSCCNLPEEKLRAIFLIDWSLVDVLDKARFIKILCWRGGGRGERKEGSVVSSIVFLRT